MFGAYGLYSHIQANRLRSAILLAGFVALLHALLFSLLMLWSALLGGTFGEIVEGAWWQFRQSWPVAMIAAAIWFVIAYFMHQWLVRMATGARGVARADAPQLYNALENLCISRGIPMPALQIIETPALNAYASGVHEGQYVISVTRGLVDTLAPDEIEAVLAHELTHIRNRDAQLMVVAVIFAGIIAFFGNILIRMWDFPYGWSPTPRRSRDGGGGAALLALAIAIGVIVISWGISTLIRIALSRSREFLADAGSAELTKNPEALIRALRKIEGHARFDVPSRMEAFFIENPVAGRLTGLLATHPPIAARIEALGRYAGAEQESVAAAPR
jgi:heat shock protein HtpX